MPWVESPSYLLRRWTVLWALQEAPPGRLLEIGCGAGDLLSRFTEHGHTVTCVEISPDARAEARKRLESVDPPVRILPKLDQVSGAFNLLVACEVLEHIRDDQSALKEWTARLVLGGRLLITVPAHPHRFGASDKWAGHYRRYTREELKRKATQAGLQVEQLICFGYPLGNLIEPIRNWVKRRRLEREEKQSRSKRTHRSGIDRSIERRLQFLAKPWLIVPFCWLQIPFFKSDLGTGYLLSARRFR